MDKSKAEKLEKNPKRTEMLLVTVLEKQEKKKGKVNQVQGLLKAKKREKAVMLILTVHQKEVKGKRTPAGHKATLRLTIVNPVRMRVTKARQTRPCDGQFVYRKLKMPRHQLAKRKRWTQTKSVQTPANMT